MNSRSQRSRAILLSSIFFAACTQTAEHEHGEEEHDHGAEAQKKHGAHEEGTVHLSPEAIARAKIELYEVLSLPRQGGVEVPAELRLQSDREAHVSSVVSGQVAKVFAEVGDTVKIGQPLLSIRSVALGEARAAAARARADLSVAQSNFQRQEQLSREGIGAQRQLLESKATLRRAQAAQTAAARALSVYGRGSGSTVVVKAPIAGHVVFRHATVGEVVEPGAVLFQVTNTDKVWAVGRVYQQQAGLVQRGAPAVLTLQSYPGQSFSGTLDYVAPALDEHTRTLPVRMTLDNEKGILRPGSFGSLSISPKSEGEATVPAIPIGALQRVGEETVVFVPGDEAGEFRATPVELLSKSAGLARIARGLKPGQRVVSEGAFVLKSTLMQAELGEGHVH